jgi:diguanylate cyclase (GGDEF)-like protein
MNYTFSVPVNDPSKVSVFNDNINGGRSIGALSFEENRPTMKCQIIRSGTFAFCGLWFSLIKDDRLLNAHQFQSLTIDLEYESRERDTLLIYLLNEERVGTQKIARSNQTTIVPKQGRHSYTVQLDQFFVPSWWIFQQPDNILLEPNLDQVRTLQISTGDSTRNRNLTFQLHSATFTGKWITGRQLAIAIVILWTILAFIKVVQLFASMRIKWQKSRNQAKNLTDINRFLKIERDQFETLAKNDPLTGCLNRNGLSDVLKSIMESYHSEKNSTCLILCDIDFFKRINDSFGHDEGDAVLINLANLIRQHIRDTDYVIRWGGEEFAIICTQTSLSGANFLAENLRQRIAESTLTTESNVTASFGVALMKSSQIDHWFKSADDALYAAKAAGRNQVKQAA